ncbi:unnamed protein product, partial [Discosporangium mesarthrocarpum]
RRVTAGFSAFSPLTLGLETPHHFSQLMSRHPTDHSRAADKEIDREEKRKPEEPSKRPDGGRGRWALLREAFMSALKTERFGIEGGTREGMDEGKRRLASIRNRQGFPMFPRKESAWPPFIGHAFDLESTMEDLAASADKWMDKFASPKARLRCMAPSDAVETCLEACKRLCALRGGGSKIIKVHRGEETSNLEPVTGLAPQ